MDPTDYFIQEAINKHKCTHNFRETTSSFRRLLQLAKKYEYAGGHGTCGFSTNNPDTLIPCFMFRRPDGQYLHVLYLDNKNPIYSLKNASALSERLGKNINASQWNEF